MGRLAGLGFVTVFAVGVLSACGDGSTAGPPAPRASQVTRVSSAYASEGPATALASHQVVYQVDVVQGQPDQDLIGWGYTDPTTNQHESLTPRAAPLPWSKSFTTVNADAQVSVTINNDSDASLSCTILVDGQAVATSIAKPHNADPGGGVCLANLRH